MYLILIILVILLLLGGSYGYHGGYVYGGPSLSLGAVLLIVLLVLLVTGRL